MNDDLKIIKKKYGENMMHLCRRLFSTILDNNPGLLSELLLNHFNPSKELYEDIIEQGKEREFSNFIYNFVDVKEMPLPEVYKTPTELLKEAGYTLYECKSEEDIQSFKKYYKNGEELCTFRGNRLDTCHVFFAVKDNVDDIKRENFSTPKREDEYGTSVISIQFTRDQSHTLSIKNRYNHTVPMCDATFSNNLDNIIPGLTRSFEKYYGMIQKHDSKGIFLRDYVQANDGRFYKYNYEINNIYYCPNNIIIDNFNPKKLDEKYLLIDYFLFDLKNKKFIPYDEQLLCDKFTDRLNNIKNIQIENNKEGKRIILFKENGDNIILFAGKDNKIKTIYDETLKECPDNFLAGINGLEEVYFPNVKKVGDSFLESCSSLSNIDMPLLEETGNLFLDYAEKIEQVSFPNLKKVKNNFLRIARNLKTINFPKLEEVGDSFLEFNEKLTTLSLPEITQAGDSFMSSNKVIENIFAPKLEKVGNSFVLNARNLKNIQLDSLTEKGVGYMASLDETVEKSYK